MLVPVGTRLVQACESMCEDIRRAVGLTLFRVELQRRSTPLVITLRGSDPLRFDPRHEWMRYAAPARIEHALLVRGRVIGTLRIEDERRSEYPADAVEKAQTVIARYVGEIADLLEEGQLGELSTPA